MNILLLRGLTREKSHWGTFLPKLKRSLPEAQVFCLDLPGAGTENEKESPLSIDGIMEELRSRWLNELKGSGRKHWFIVGHSLGGMITLDWINRFPKDFKTAFLINTSSRGHSQFWRRIRPVAFHEFIKIARAIPGPEREQLVLKLTSNLKSDNEKILRDWVEFARRRPIKQGTAIRQIIAASQFQAEISPNAKLVFLCAKADRLVHFQASQALAEVASSPCYVHEEAGHDLPLDDPDWLIEHICEEIRHR